MVRVKYRHVLIAVDFKTNRISGKLGPEEVCSALKLSLSIDYGQAGLRCIAPSLSVQHINTSTGACILRIGRCHCAKLLESLSSVKSMCHRPVHLHLIGVSGSRVKIERMASQQHKKLFGGDTDAHLP